MGNLEKLSAKERVAQTKQLRDRHEAIDTLKVIVQDHPKCGAAWIELGNSYHKVGKPQLALETLESAIKISPKNPEILIELATEQLNFNQIEAGRQNLERVVELTPKRAKALVRLGKVYQQEGRPQAEELFQRALRSNPKAKEASIGLANSAADSGKFDEAIKYLEQALAYAPKDFRLLVAAGEIERKQQDHTAALEYFQKAIAANPEHIRSHICQVNTLWDLRRFDEAEDYLKKLQIKYPDNFAVLIRSGQMAKQLGQRKEALQWFRQAHSQATPTQQARTQYFIIQELNAIGLLEEALEEIESAIAQFPDDLRFLTTKGNILQAQVDLPQAAEIYQHILSQDPHHFDSRIELAKVYSQSGRVEQAIDLLEETNRLVGADIKTFIQLGSLYQALENWDLAATWYKKACLEFPQKPRGYCKLANLIFLQDDVETAIELLQNAYQKLPYHPQIVVELIKLQTRLGNFEESDRLINSEIKRFSHHTAFKWQLCGLRIKQGEYAAALNILEHISTDNSIEKNRIEGLKANIYFLQSDFKKAEEHIRKAIALTSSAVSERVKLANILYLTGRIHEAYQELKIATEYAIFKTSAGKTAAPLKSFTAVIINLLRIHPPMLKKLLEADRKLGREKILAFGSLLNEEPNYFGSALYLARELREQGIFAQLQQTLSTNPTNIPQIPRRIVQFWDDPQPPPEVQRICQSWKALNPEYEYQLFSLDMAIAFIKEHYDARVSQAFANCEHPATQADFFRLAYLSKMGGFYVDADDLCRQSLESLVSSKPELVILQENVVTFGNNFLGCIAGQTMITQAFHRAIDNLNNYSNESPWAMTGPALITSVICGALVPYLSQTNYQTWPRLMILIKGQFSKIVNSHLSLPYKSTDKSWIHQAYKRVNLNTLSLQNKN